MHLCLLRGCEGSLDRSGPRREGKSFTNGQMSLISLNSAFLMTASWCGGVAPLAGGQREGGVGEGSRRGQKGGEEGEGLMGWCLEM